MNIALWIVQSLLAILFLFWGILFITQTKENLAEHSAWVEDFSGSQIRLIGVLDILGAVGLILPALTGILSWLTPLAAIGLALMMVGAILTQIRRKDYGSIILPVILLLAALFVAYGRFIMVTPS